MIDSSFGRYHLSKNKCASHRLMIHSNRCSPNWSGIAMLMLTQARTGKHLHTHKLTRTRVYIVLHKFTLTHASSLIYNRTHATSHIYNRTHAFTLAYALHKHTLTRAISLILLRRHARTCTHVHICAITNAFSPSRAHMHTQEQYH